MGLKQRQAKARFQNQRCELELEKQRLALEKARRDLDRPAVPAHPGRAAWGECPAAGKPFRGILLICAIVHVLLAVWVFSDIRHRNAGSGLWIVIALLSGLFGALVYAVARLGDKPAQT